MPLTADERKRVKQAIVTLARYNKDPYITQFVRAQPSPKISVNKFDRKLLCELLKIILLGLYKGKKRYVIKLVDLISYLDRLQESGRQHIYLFQIPEPKQEDALAWLQDLAKVKARLGGKDEIYDGGQLVWEAREGPELAQVRREPNGSTPKGSLVLKWVQTRDYWVPKTSPEAAEFDELKKEAPQFESSELVLMNEAESETKASQSDEEDEDQETDEPSIDVRIRVRLEERAVSFLVIDLDKGDCELRIQGLRGGGLSARLEQLATYRSLLTQFFGFELIGPSVLAPAIRRVLITREVELLFCEAILPEGGRFIGEKDEFPPVDVRKLGAGLATGFKWRQPEGGLGRITLDGLLDEIFVARPLLLDQQRLMLGRIRKWREEGLVDLSLPANPKPEVSKAVPAPVISQRPYTQPSPLRKPTRNQARRALAIVRAAFTGGVQAEPPAVEPGINNAIREYTETHASEKPDSAAGRKRKRKKGGTGAGPVSANELPLEQFLNYIKEVASSERLNYEREIKSVLNDEKWNSRLYFTAAVLALAIITTGVILLTFGSSRLTIGGITSLLGVLTGNGTRLIHSYRQSLKAKRTLIQQQQRDSQDTLLMIQAALVIQDPKKRSSTMEEVATKLLNRLTRVTVSPTPHQKDDKAEPTPSSSPR